MMINVRSLPLYTYVCRMGNKVSFTRSMLKTLLMLFGMSYVNILPISVCHNMYIYIYIYDGINTI